MELGVQWPGQLSVVGLLGIQATQVTQVQRKSYFRGWQYCLDLSSYLFKMRKRRADGAQGLDRGNRMTGKQSKRITIYLKFNSLALF